LTEKRVSRFQCLDFGFLASNYDVETKSASCITILLPTSSPSSQWFGQLLHSYQYLDAIHRKWKVVVKYCTGCGSIGSANSPTAFDALMVKLPVAAMCRMEVTLGCDDWLGINIHCLRHCYHVHAERGCGLCTW